MMASKTVFNLTFFRSVIARKQYGGHKKRQYKISRYYLCLLSNITAMAFTGTIFLGGSYLFFIKLAEFGW